MSIDKFPPPPKVEPAFDAWLLRFYKAVSAGGDSAITNHSSLSNLNSPGYSHISSEEKEALTGGGATVLHYHLSDRDRANHVGTQSATTIYDFQEAVQFVNAGGAGLALNVLEGQIFGA